MNRGIVFEKKKRKKKKKYSYSSTIFELTHPRRKINLITNESRNHFQKNKKKRKEAIIIPILQRYLN